MGGDVLVAAVALCSRQAISDRLSCHAWQTLLADTWLVPSFFQCPMLRSRKEGYLRSGLLVLEGLGLDGADAHDCDCVRGVYGMREEEEGRRIVGVKV